MRVKAGVFLAAVATALVVCPLSAAAPAGPVKSVPAIGSDASAGAILGTVWDAQNQPLPDATVRLRNLTTGRIEAMTRASSTGQFTFQSVDGGNYVLEVVNDEGRVIAVGQTFSVAPGETVATFVRLAGHQRWFAGFFNNAAVSAVTSAAAVGLTAVAAAGQAVSPTQ